MKPNRKQFAIGMIFAFICIGAMAAVNGVFANINASGFINSVAGYRYNGTAPSGDTLCGNGTNFIACALWYQTVDAAGSSLTQQPVLNFDSTMSAANGSGQTNVGLPSVGANGTFANPSSVTVDAQGRTTSVTAGVSVDQWITFTSCVPATDGDVQVCQGGPISWPVAFANTSYFIDSCMVDDSSTFTSNPPPTAVVQFHSKTTSGFSYTLTDIKGSSGPYPYSWPVTCHGHHN